MPRTVCALQCGHLVVLARWARSDEKEKEDEDEEGRRRLDCARDSTWHAIHSTQSEAHWQWQKCNFVSCERNRLAFAMPCHARHCATLMAGSQQGRTKRPLAIGGPCRAQNLRPTDQSQGSLV